MYGDYEVIKHKLPKELEFVNLFGIADWHVGSPECNMRQIEGTINAILEDEHNYCVIAGDALNNGLKQSKTNSYLEILSPMQQKEKLYELLKPLAEEGKILAVCDGNHEARSVITVGVSPLYDTCCRLRIEDVFRQNMCLVKLQFGVQGFGRKDQQNTYGGLVIHGASKARHQKYEVGAIEGLDWCISGHTHQPEMTSRSKIRLDLITGTAKPVHFQSLVCCPALTHGGYGVQKEYMPTAFDELQYITLRSIGSDKIKRMEYHTRQL